MIAANASEDGQGSGAGLALPHPVHHFVRGGAVRGGRFHGRMPSLARTSGPDDAGCGQIIPSAEVEPYAAALAAWFGVNPDGFATRLPLVVEYDSANPASRRSASRPTHPPRELCGGVQPRRCLQDARIRSAARSAIIMVGALVLPPGRLGMTDASTTRRPSTPRTRSSGSTTATSSLPMRQVPIGW